MEKSVLISIKPKWAKKISNGKKIVEIRKTKPKIQTPFKCYIYQSGKNLTKTVYGSELSKNGYVVGEFVCDEIIEDRIGENADIFMLQGCVSFEQLKKYCPKGILYGWHISNLLIYDKPKELNEFKRMNRTENNVPCAHTKWLYEPCETCKECNLKRPPLSWCYVEELPQ